MIVTLTNKINNIHPPAISTEKHLPNSTNLTNKNGEKQVCPLYFLQHRASINRAKVNFKSYHGDPAPAKKLFYLTSGKSDIYEDNFTHKNIYITGNKRWVNASATELLKRTPEQAIQSICTLTKPEKGFPHIPNRI